MNKINTTWTRSLEPTSLFLVSIFTVLSVGCTGQIPNAFRIRQQEEAFSSSQEVNTKIDMLWVVDNSPSMWPTQKKIRDGFRLFADTYMKPGWDIRVAVISQDTYLAHPSFQGFLNGIEPTGSAARYSRSAGFVSSYFNVSGTANPKRTTPFVNPSWWGTGAISPTGKVTGGIKLRHAIPEYGGANPALDVSPTNPSQYARLVSGRHDGPLATLCWTSNDNSFFFGVAKCHVRDQQDAYQGVDDCVRGGAGNLDSSVQCVNTIMNNTVRSGKPIISTRPPEGVSANGAWTEQLYKDFLVNLSGGVSGYPLEKYFNSIAQFIADNESASSDTKFFRPDTLRVIVIVTDEDDQSTVLPSPATQITPDSHYEMDNANCSWKTVTDEDGFTHTYRIQVCSKANKVMAVSDFKSQLDTFFLGLDGADATEPGYFVVTITPTTARSLKDLHGELGETGNSYGSVSADVPTRLFAFSDMVGNGSLKLELTSNDYSPLLNSIGRVIVSKKATYSLARAPTSGEDLVVKIKHADGSVTVIPPSKYTVDGRIITITDDDVILGMSATDLVSISYQPKTVF
jgi:hypothetical protein